MRIKQIASLLFSLIIITLTLFTNTIHAKELPINTRLGGHFKLPGTLNRPVALNEYEGKVLLLNFGYTTCPDICPMVLSRLSQTLKRLKEDSDQVQVLFISFDHERDTIHKLQQYLAHFNSNIIGFTGTKAELKTVAKQYGAIFAKQQTSVESDVLYAHSDYIYLLDQKNRIRKLYASDHNIDEIVADVRSLLKGQPWWKKLAEMALAE